MQSNPNSKKRKFGDISNQQQADEELLFGAGDGARREEFEFRGAGDEAEEDDQDIHDDVDAQADEEGAGSEDEAEGEDILENMEDDYQEKPELDRYEADGLDDEGDHAELDYQQRREIERNMDQDARMRQQRGRRAGAFMDDNEYSENEEIARQMRMDRMKALHGDGNVAMDDDQEMNEVIDFEDVKGQVSQWVQKQEVIRWIRKTFGSFLRNFKDDSNTGVYEERIREMCSNNK
jgi:DNA replication licensing factor MCM2